MLFGLTVLSMIITVEILQAVTMTGFCDIDDVLLNFTGAAMVYAIIQAKPVKEALNSFYVKLISND